MSEQRFVHPPGLLDAESPGRPIVWTCVRTKPRWEKRFAQWLVGRGIPHFLPVVVVRKMHYRRERVSELPLFPGYVFVAADKDKGDFRESCSVLCLIKPHECQAPQLHEQLWNLWRGLAAGSHLELTNDLKVGDPVEVTTGPLKGVRGRFERWSAGGRLILQLDVLGIGAALEVPDGCVTVPL